MSEEKKEVGTLFGMAVRIGTKTEMNGYRLKIVNADGSGVGLLVNGIIVNFDSKGKVTATMSEQDQFDKGAEDFIDNRPDAIKRSTAGSVLNLWPLTRQSWARGTDCTVRIDGHWFEEGRNIGVIGDGQHVVVIEAQRVNPQLPRGYLIFVVSADNFRNKEGG